MALSPWRRFQISLSTTLAYGLFKLWFGTCRFKVLNPEIHRQFLLNSRPFIGATWHRGAILTCYYYGRFQPLVLFSQSQDGEYLAQFARKCGMIPVRGSSTRGGLRALIQMIRLYRNHPRPCATVLDGPQGPRYVAKKGFLLLAQKTGAPILPGIWSARRTITLEKTWDKTMLPLPFSRVLIAYAPPLTIPEKASEEELEGFRRELENRLNRLMVEVDRACGYQTRGIEGDQPKQE